MSEHEPIVEPIVASPPAGAEAPPSSPPASTARLDPNRALDYNLTQARFFDLPRSDGISLFKEKASLNQYWYAESSVAAILAELSSSLPASARIAFVSCPSLFFGLPAEERLRAGHALLEIDADSFGAAPGFVAYDHCAPEALPAALAGAFDAVCLDPPLISSEVWELTARAARFLLGERGRAVIASTVPGNAALLARLFGARRVRFRPELPHLVHSFSLYTNFEPRVLCLENADFPGDGRADEG